MDNRCYIITPVKDPEGYAQGHVDRVFQYILVPACRLAGLTPTRASDPVASDTPMDILRNLIECDIVVADLSAKYPNALYAFAIRQSMSLPVVMIKDAKTRVPAELQVFEPLEYDDSLRIDTVQKEVEALTELLKKTLAAKSDRNPLVSRFDFGSVGGSATGAGSDQEEAPHHTESSLPVISPVPDYVGNPITRQEDLDKLKQGDSVFHINYGKGEILSLSRMAKDKVVKIQFESGTKLLVLVPTGIFRQVNK
jgi:hypothetical protein